jgi:hypothetical protein
MKNPKIQIKIYPYEKPTQRDSELIEKTDKLYILLNWQKSKKYFKSINLRKKNFFADSVIMGKIFWVFEYY